MDEHEFHDMIIRIEERTRNIWRVVEKLEKHQSEQNGYIRIALTRSKVNRVLLSVGGVIATTVIGWITKIEGLW